MLWGEQGVTSNRVLRVTGLRPWHGIYMQRELTKISSSPNCCATQNIMLIAPVWTHRVILKGVLSSFLVGEARYVPNTQFLGLLFRSELIQAAA